jgi:hypothetical protein
MNHPEAKMSLTTCSPAPGSEAKQAIAHSITMVVARSEEGATVRRRGLGSGPKKSTAAPAFRF